MPFFQGLLCFIFLFLLVGVGVPLQLNLYLTERMNNNENDIVVQHDCLRVDAWENEEDDIYEITSYCMGEWSTKWNIQRNNSNQIFTFQELLKLNITSQQLYLWSAPMDIVEHYQNYLDQLSISNETLLSTYSYYNCTLPKFGPMCQYSFDGYESYDLSLNEIIYEFYQTYAYEMENKTCYIHLQCNLGLTSLCIGWINICDGTIQCIDGIDEEHCWQLEINECNEDEYRCRNGQCIPLSFLNDNFNAPDCFDGSDENQKLKYTDSWDPSGPLFKWEDIFCLRFIYDLFLSRILKKRRCFDSDFLNYKNSKYFPEKPNTISDVCWLALNCYLMLRVDLNLNCNDICKNETCKHIINEHCPDMFCMPHVPIVFGHIYFAYTKQYIIEQNKLTTAPDYICYNEQLCGGFLPNRTLVSFNNTTCRRLQDFPLRLSGPSSPGVWLYAYVGVVYENFYKCNTILRNDSTFCNRSTMYQCMNSSKCIAQIRLLDRRDDCDYKDDESPISTDYNCPIRSPQMYVNCTKNNNCISRKLVNDGTCHCSSDMNYDLCDDEPSELDYIRYHISFPTICDNYTDLKPILINGQYETDETECEQWVCNNIYNRCNGIWNCFNGEDELDCYPSSLINCSLHSYGCFSSKTGDFMCLSADKINDGNIDCLGTADEQQCCGKSSLKIMGCGFYCNAENQNSVSQLKLCDGEQQCSQGEDEKFCHHIKTDNFFTSVGVCRSKDISVRSDVEEFLCNLFTCVPSLSRFVYFSLSKMRKSDNRITKRNTDTKLTPFLTTKTFLRSQNPCHRSLSIRTWLNHETNLIATSCLCPPSYYGDRCQFQNERVSLTIRFGTFSDSWQTPFIVVVLLIDDSDERTIHSHEQFTYIPASNCKTKFNIDLLYSTRPKNQSKQYSIHIDVYKKISLLYRGSLLMPLSFPFFPVQRVAVELSIPHTGHNFKNCTDHQCVHGQCIQYFDDPKHSKFCQCSPGWSGRYCTIPHTCMCSSDSLCIGKLASNRSICVCPMHKWGSRCLLHDQVCQSNVTCDNGGQCIPIDRYALSKKQFTCICPKGFFGEACEIPQNKIILSFEKDMILPQSMLIHFIEVKDNADPENGTTFKMIPFDRNPVTIYWSRSFHIAFVEFILHSYYLIVVQNIYNQSKTTERTLRSSDRCPNISEVFNETFFQLHLIRRIKYYHLPCQRYSPQLSCFYDDVHMCLCNDFDGQRQAYCFEFNHTLKQNCRGQSKCENNAQCLQDRANCPETFMCICPPCFYGALCQFSLSGFGLSLDGILGNHIQPNISIKYQPVIVQISLTLSVLITALGLISGILSIITFMNKEPRKIGCGVYLIGSSITTLFTTIIFSLKFWILLAAQMAYITDRSFLYFQCYSIDFILRIGLNMDQWLNSCVATERAMTVIKGISFDKAKSRRITKFIIPTLLFVIIGTNIHEIINRRLIDDDSNDEKRIWCVITYSASVQKYNLVVNMFHFCTPFVINVLSAITIIIKTARLRANAKTEQHYQTILLEQLQQHKNLLISSVLLVILAIPRLIITFVSGCMESAADAWPFLIGYFISFIPPISNFFIFVLPSKTYKDEFYKTVQRYQQRIRTRFRLFH